MSRLIGGLGGVGSRHSGEVENRDSMACHAVQLCRGDVRSLARRRTPMTVASSFSSPNLLCFSLPRSTILAAEAGETLIGSGLGFAAAQGASYSQELGFPTGPDVEERCGWDSRGAGARGGHPRALGLGSGRGRSRSARAGSWPTGCRRRHQLASVAGGKGVRRRGRSWAVCGRARARCWAEMGF